MMMRTSSEQAVYDALLADYERRGGVVHRCERGAMGEGGMFRIGWWVAARMASLKWRERDHQDDAG